MNNLNPWQQLTKSQINEKQALNLLINSDKSVNLELLDQGLTKRFFAQFKDKNNIPNVMPLLLWRNCYYLGSPRKITPEQEQYLKFCLNTQIKIFRIDVQSYLTWYRQHLHQIDYDSFRVSAIEKVTTGITTIEEIKRVLPHSVLRKSSFASSKYQGLQVVNAS